MPPIPAPLVWINGFPGSGKLTVARLAGALDDTVVVLDNHKLIDPVEAHYPRTHPEYQQQRAKYRRSMLFVHANDPTTLSQLIICTDFQSDSPIGRETAHDYQSAALAAGRPFIPLYLTCDPAENLERVASPERVNSGTTKLTDAAVLRDLLSRCSLFRFPEYPDWVIDSTKTPPLHIARAILVSVRARATSPSDQAGTTDSGLGANEQATGLQEELAAAPGSKGRRDWHEDLVYRMLTSNF